MISSRGNAEVVINTGKTLGPGSQTKLHLQRICDLSELVLARFSSENQVSVLPGSTAEEFHGIVGVSDSIRHLWNEIVVAAENEETVLITGETGTGKELVARGIYLESSRNGGPYVSINCAALSEDLLMAELFGDRKGSLTGAHTDRLGVFEDDDGIRELVEVALAGYEVVSVPNGEVGLETFFSSPFDLVLVDMSLPGKNGSQVADTIKSDQPGVPIVLMSGWTTENIDLDTTPFDSLIDKPFLIGELVTVIESALKG